MLRQLLFPILLLLFFSTTQAQNAKELVKLTWKGKSKQDADFTETGYVILTQSLTMTLGTDGKSITGIATTTLKFDGVSYTKKTSVKGTLNEKSYTIENFKDDAIISSDPLPNGLR
jgi:hypothetical protein